MKDTFDTRLQVHKDCHMPTESIERRMKDIIMPDTDIFESIKETLDGIMFRDGKMHFTTKRCTIHYKPRHLPPISVDMGYFNVSVNFDTYTMTMTQMDINKYISGVYDHPHINHHNPCLGTYFPEIKRAIERIDVCRVITLILDYLNSCSQGWYCPIWAWISVDQRANYVGEFCERCEQVIDDCECDNCRNCGDHVDDCNCSYCDSCDQYNDNCECLHCPDSGDRLDGSEFPDTGCISCSNLVRDLYSDEWICAYNGTDEPYYAVPLDNFNVQEPNARARYRTRDLDGSITNHPVVNERTNV
jgi:hypothetical protein